MNKINLTILISGAGIAGPALAYWLKRYGHTPILVERSPQLRIGGYKVDIRGIALDVIKHMGLHDKVAAEYTDILSAKVVDAQGQVISELSGDRFNLREGDDLEIMRGTLSEILIDHLKGVECINNDCIESIVETSLGVEVTFEKGDKRTVDLVVGADGLHSHMRKLVFGDEEKFARHLGAYISIFSLPNYLNLDRCEIEYAVPGRLVDIYSISGATNARAAFLFRADSLPEGYRQREVQEKLLKQVYGNDGWEIPKLLEIMSTASDFYFDSIMQIAMPHWSKGRVVLLGDAGYCASPASGQGTSLALVGAYVLAGELAKSAGDYTQAFTEYERILRPYVNANQKFGQQCARDLVGGVSKGVKGWLHQRLNQWMPGFIVEYKNKQQLKRIQAAANAIKLQSPVC